MRKTEPRGFGGERAGDDDIIIVDRQFERAQPSAPRIESARRGSPARACRDGPPGCSVTGCRRSAPRKSRFGAEASIRDALALPTASVELDLLPVPTDWRRASVRKR